MAVTTMYHTWWCANRNLKVSQHGSLHLISAAETQCLYCGPALKGRTHSGPDCISVAMLSCATCHVCMRIYALSCAVHIHMPMRMQS